MRAGGGVGELLPLRLALLRLEAPGKEEEPGADGGSEAEAKPGGGGGGATSGMDGAPGFGGGALGGATLLLRRVFVVVDGLVRVKV